MAMPFIPGLELARQFHAELVGPLLDQSFPGITYSAALIGWGSDVLGVAPAGSGAGGARAGGARAGGARAGGARAGGARAGGARAGGARAGGARAGGAVSGR